MKKIVFAFGISVLFISCKGVSQEVINKMADEMCEAMELLNSDNPMGDIEAVGAIVKVRENEEYSDVSEEDLIKAMEKNCPKGAVKMKDNYMEEE